MIRQGVDVINYSASELWDGPGDGTSSFSWSTLRSVDLAVGSGIIWTNSAGNGAMETWYGSFVDVEGDDLHNFEGADGCNTFTIEDFSSLGPTPDGRVKPDILGSDGAFSATYRGNWFATSQTSAHVAGLAALARQRFPSRSPQQIAEYLKSNANARGASPNNTWGYGFARLPSPGAVQPTTESHRLRSSVCSRAWQ